LTRNHPEPASKLPGAALDEQLRRERLSAQVELGFIRQPGWLCNADLAATAEAWGALVPYAEPGHPWFHAPAARRVRLCEARLRDGRVIGV
jgi:hypothetical protein